MPRPLLLATPLGVSDAATSQYRRKVLIMCDLLCSWCAQPCYQREGHQHLQSRHVLRTFLQKFIASRQGTGRVPGVCCCLFSHEWMLSALATNRTAHCANNCHALTCRNHCISASRHKFHSRRLTPGCKCTAATCSTTAAALYCGCRWESSAASLCAQKHLLQLASCRVLPSCHHALCPSLQQHASLSIHSTLVNIHNRPHAKR